MMSIERELLTKIQQCLQYDCADIYEFAGDIVELLAQPEQDNTQYLLDQVARLTAENAMLKEKWLAPRRKPLSDEEIGVHTPFYYYDTEQKAFTHGVRLAEQQHGIGVDDE